MSKLTSPSQVELLGLNDAETFGPVYYHFWDNLIIGWPTSEFPFLLGS